MYKEMWERFKEHISMILDEGREMGYDKPESENSGKFFAYDHISREMKRIEKGVISRRRDGYQVSTFFIDDMKIAPDQIQKVIFNDPATVVIWKDGTKTVVKCQPGDTYDKEKGLALCISKKVLGNKGNFNEIFKKYIPADEEKKPADEEYKPKISVSEMREALITFCKTNDFCRDCVLYCDSCYCGRDKYFDEFTDDEIIRLYKATYEHKTDLIKPVRVKVLNAGDGAHCADDKVGVLLPIGSKKATNGLLAEHDHLLFEADNGIVYRISKDSDIELLR